MLKEFKVFYGGTSATREQLDAIDEIVVEQEIGRAWEARIMIPIRIAEDGSWNGENDSAYAEFARVRVEARIGDGEFVPLIDGRITDQDPGMDTEPGMSTLTLTVQDDTTILHREAAAESFTGESDSAIARSVFGSANLGGRVDVEDTGAPTDANAVVRRRGTPMQLLRLLMRRHPDFYAYVLPGQSPGTSDCCFKKLPASPDSALLDLVLTGPERNISGFRIQRMSNRAARHVGASLSMSDHSVATGSASSADAAPSDGEAATTPGGSDLRTRRLPPGIGDFTEMSEAAEGAALDSSFTVRADGDVLPQCYGAILSPYRMVRARVSNSRYSANYVIFKVVHTLGLSEYTQSFSVRGNAVSFIGFSRRIAQRANEDFLMDTSEYEDQLIDLAESRNELVFGKYRGTVDSVEEGDDLGIISVKVPELFGADHVVDRVRPCSPFAGSDHGLVVIPEPGDGVWVEFEAGNVSLPDLEWILVGGRRDARAQRQARPQLYHDQGPHAAARRRCG